MKKQFLTLGLFLLAAMAGINESSAQTKAVTWSTPEKLSCPSDELHPLAGKEYIYKAGVKTDPTITADQEGHWRFWATRDRNFIVDGVFNYDQAIAEGANGILIEPLDYNKDFEDANADADGEITLSWTSGLLNSVINAKDSLYVVAYYQNAAGCTDQANVWVLEPQNFFTVDIIAMDQTQDFVLSKNGYDKTPAVCVDEIQSMTIKNGELVYDYGDNYIYFEFIAANFTDYWIPEFTLGGDLSEAQVPTYQYTYETPDKWNDLTDWKPLVSGTTHIEPEGDYTDAGVSVFVRVKIDHNNYENLDGQTLTMYLDGLLEDGTYDTVNETCIDPDPMGPDKNDSASTTITLRPENDSRIPNLNFMTTKNSVNN